MFNCISTLLAIVLGYEYIQWRKGKKESLGKIVYIWASRRDWSDLGSLLLVMSIVMAVISIIVSITVYTDVQGVPFVILLVPVSYVCLALFELVFWLDTKDWNRYE